MRAKRINELYGTLNTSHNSNITFEDEAQEEGLINRSLMSRINHKNLKTIDKAQIIMKEARNFHQKRLNIAQRSTHEVRHSQHQQTEQQQSNKKHNNLHPLRYSHNKKTENQTLLYQNIVEQLAQPQPQEMNEGQIKKSITHIDFNIVKNYFRNKVKQFDASIPPQKIYRIIHPFYQLCGINLPVPTIKKYKNCSYFGQARQEEQLNYEGFLIYHQEAKMYYGEFKNQKKHGKGTEVDFQHDAVYVGTFSKGRKVGVFNVIKPHEKYVGQISKGLYQGYGELSTVFSIYKGSFSKGQRHGEGEEHFLKMGLTICGTFVNNKFTNNEAGVAESKIIENKDEENTKRLKPTSKADNPQQTSRLIPLVKQGLGNKKLTFQVFDCEFMAEDQQIEDEMLVLRERKNAFRIKGRQQKRSYSEQKKEERTFMLSTLHQ